MQKKTNKIVLIGAGNLATQLAHQLVRKGFCISQVYSQTTLSAQTLADSINANYTISVDEIDKNADLYICALKDDALPEVLSRLKEIKGVIVHTAGSVDIAVFERKFKQFGVFYPLQTFSKTREVAFGNIPIFVEASDSETLQYLKDIAFCISKKVYEANSYQRKMLHLSAVFACNFVNHLYVQADEIVKKSGFDFDVLLPLIDETAQKVHSLNPIGAQTGPAVRFDETIMQKHLSLLENDKDKELIYKLISNNIHEKEKK